MHGYTVAWEGLKINLGFTCNVDMMILVVNVWECRSIVLILSQRLMKALAFFSPCTAATIIANPIHVDICTENLLGTYTISCAFLHTHVKYDHDDIVCTSFSFTMLLT